MNPLLIIVPAVANGVFYRMGGSGRYPRFTRPLGIGLMTMLAMWVLGLWHWSVIICAGLMAGASTSYFKKKGSDAKWINWMCVGIAFSFTILPYAIFTHQYTGFIIRSVVCTAAITLWSQFINWDVLEEWGRGFIAVASLSLLLIGA